MREYDNIRPARLDLPKEGVFNCTMLTNKRRFAVLRYSHTA